MHDGRRRALLVVLVLGAAIAVPVLAQHLSGTVPVDDGVPLSSSSNLTIVLDGQTDAYLTDFTPASDRVALITEAGNATFEGQDARLVIDKGQIDNDWMNVTGVEASSGYVVLDVGTTNATRIGGNLSSFQQRRQDAIDSGEVDDGAAEYGYSASSGTSDLYFVGDSGLPNTVALADSSGTYLAFASEISAVNGNLNYEATGLPSGTNDLYIQSNDGGPSVTNVHPSGDQNTEPSQITADVSDPDIADGDDVTVTFNLDNSQIGQQTVGSNGTVSTSMPSSGQTGGSHDITVDVEDSFGATDSATSSYRAPDTLYIRNETNHSELIDSPIDSTVRFFGSDEVYTRQTSDGTVNMTNLPVNQDFIVEVSPSGNFTDRTVQIQSIYEQQSVYLLNTTVYSTIESRFELNDPTGQFDSTTVIYIQKPVNISGNVSYQTIHADEFGVEGVTATLQSSQRYRVKVKNTEGVSQIIGPYRSDVAETVEVRPGNPTVQLPEDSGTWGATASLDNTTLEYVYNDSAGATDELVVFIYEKGNKSNTLQPNQTYTNIGVAEQSLSLTPNESELTWVVAFDITRDNSEFVRTVEVTKRPSLVPPISREWRLIVAIGLLLLSAGAFSVLNAGVGAVVVAVEAALLWFTGWLEGATAFGGVVLALFVAVMVHIYAKTAR